MLLGLDTLLLGFNLNLNFELYFTLLDMRDMPEQTVTSTTSTSSIAELHFTGIPLIDHIKH